MSVPCLKYTLEGLHQVVTQSTDLVWHFDAKCTLERHKKRPISIFPLPKHCFLTHQSETNLPGRDDENLLVETIFVAELKADQRNMVHLSFNHIGKNNFLLRYILKELSDGYTLPFLCIIQPPYEDEMPTTTFWILVNDPAKHTHPALL